VARVQILHLFSGSPAFASGSGRKGCSGYDCNALRSTSNDVFLGSGGLLEYWTGNIPVALQNPYLACGISLLSFGVFFLSRS